MNNPSTNIREILSQAAGGSEKAFTILFNEYRQKVYNVAWTYTRDAKLAEDILQDSFVLLWKHREKLTGIDYVGRYLYTIARNRAVRVLQNLESLRKTNNLFSSVQAQVHPDFTKELSERAMEVLVQQGLERLSIQQRQVFELSRLQGLSREEVAEKMKISKATVGVHLTIAIRKMRVFLVDKLDHLLLVSPGIIFLKYFLPALIILFVRCILIL